MPIEDADLTGVSMRYFRDSEQIDTALLVAAEPDQNSGWRASALMLQRIPEEGGEGAVLPASKEEAEEWRPACTLMADVTSEGAIRGFTHVDGDSDILDSPLGGPAPIMHLMGGGYLAFTVDQGCL